MMRVREMHVFVVQSFVYFLCALLLFLLLFRLQSVLVYAFAVVCSVTAAAIHAVGTFAEHEAVRFICSQYVMNRDHLKLEAATTAHQQQSFKNSIFVIICQKRNYIARTKSNQTPMEHATRHH